MKNFPPNPVKWMLRAAFFIALIIPGAHAEDETNPLERFLEGFRSFQADFKQTLSNENGEILDTSSGVVYMQNPGKFRWIYHIPYTQILVTNGEVLWLYDVDLEQITVRDVETSLDSTPAAIISGQTQLENYYHLIELGTIEGYDWIELQPKDEESHYSKVRLGFEQDHLGMMILFDNLGQVTRIDFLNPKRNIALDSTLFTLDPPRGVDVIDERQIDTP